MSQLVTFHVLSVFPKMVENYCSESILKKAKEKNLVDYKFYDLRDYSLDKHKKLDDKPYGGGPGMVMSALPILSCVENILEKVTNKNTVKIVIFVPQEKKWTNVYADKFSKEYTDIILICGRYEGIDYRVLEILEADLFSIGDFVLTGGEIPAMVLIDSIARQIPGVLGDINSLEEKRVNVLGQEDKGIKEFYTRPETLSYKGKDYIVPEVFLSGNPKLIKEYKEKRDNKL